MTDSTSWLAVLVGTPELELQNNPCVGWWGRNWNTWNAPEVNAMEAVPSEDLFKFGDFPLLVYQGVHDIWFKQAIGFLSIAFHFNSDSVSVFSSSKSHPVSSPFSSIVAFGGNWIPNDAMSSWILGSRGQRGRRRMVLKIVQHLRRTRADACRRQFPEMVFKY